MTVIEKKINADSSIAAVETINKLDPVSIEALVSYVAYRHGVEEMFILSAVLKHFQVKNLKKLPHASREAVIRFLVDYKIAANAP